MKGWGGEGEEKIKMTKGGRKNIQQEGEDHQQ